GVAVNPLGTRVYVANRNSASTVTVIDTTNDADTVVGTIPPGLGSGSFPTGVALSADGGKLYVGYASIGFVSVFDTSNNAVLTNISVGGLLVGLALPPDGTKLYAGREGTLDSVAVVNLSNNSVTSIPVGSTSEGVSVTPDGARAYVAVGTNKVT